MESDAGRTQSFVEFIVAPDIHDPGEVVGDFAVR